MSLTTIPNELLIIVVSYLSVHDHSALTLTNRQLSSVLRPGLLQAIQTLPLQNAEFAILAIHWASTTGAVATLTRLLETCFPVRLDSMAPPGARNHTLHPTPVRTANLVHTTPAPVTPGFRTILLTAGPHLHISRLASRPSRYSSRTNTAARFAVQTNHRALFRIALHWEENFRVVSNAANFADRFGGAEMRQLGMLIFSDFGSEQWEREHQEIRGRFSLL